METLSSPLWGVEAPTSVPVVPAWAKHKRWADQLASAVAADRKGWHAAADMLRCAERLGVELRKNEAGELEQRVTSAHFCHHRLCPVCSWRQVQAWRRRLIPGLEAFHQAHPKHRPVFLTLTVRNCRLEELRYQLAELHEAWDRLRKRRGFPTPFWLRRTEVTIAQPPGGQSFPTQFLPVRPTGMHRRPEVESMLPTRGSAHTRTQQVISTDAVTPSSQLRDEINRLKEPPSDCLRQHWVHPHLHVLLLVPASYFGKGYIKQTRWREWWMESARLDYAPVVDVRRGYVRKTEDSGRRESVAAAIEAAKYISKATDAAALGPDLVNLEDQIRRVRMISVSRPLGQFVRPDPIEGAEMTDGPACRHEDPEVTQWFAQWDAHEERYRFGG